MLDPKTRPGGRVLLARLALTAVLTLAAGCASGPSAQDWLAVGFETPSQTLRTFQTGIRGDDPDLEYDSFSDRFRREQGLSELVYRELRSNLFGRYPYLRRFVKSRIVAVRTQGPKTRTLVVRLSALFSKRLVEVRFVRDDFFSVRAGSDVLADDYAPFAGMLSTVDGHLVLNLPTEEAIDTREVTHVVAGQEWKIDGFRQLSESEARAFESQGPEP